MDIFYPADTPAKTPDSVLKEALSHFILCIRVRGPRGGVTNQKRIWDRSTGYYIGPGDIDDRYVKIGPIYRLWRGHPDMKLCYDAPHAPPPAGSTMATTKAAVPSETRVVESGR